LYVAWNKYYNFDCSQTAIMLCLNKGTFQWKLMLRVRQSIYICRVRNFTRIKKKPSKHFKNDRFSLIFLRFSDNFLIFFWIFHISRNKKITFSGRFGPENLNIFRAGPGRAEIYKIGPGLAARSLGPCAALIEKLLSFLLFYNSVNSLSNSEIWTLQFSQFI